MHSTSGSGSSDICCTGIYQTYSSCLPSMCMTGLCIWFSWGWEGGDLLASQLYMPIMFSVGLFPTNRAQVFWATEWVIWWIWWWWWWRWCAFWLCTRCWITDDTAVAHAKLVGAVGPSSTPCVTEVVKAKQVGCVECHIKGRLTTSSSWSDCSLGRYTISLQTTHKNN